MSEFKKLLFIINKFAGTGFRPKLEGKILNACEQHRAECTIEFTSGRGHATHLARNATTKFDAVIAVGGDGTVNETAQGLVHSQTPLGILPKGSGNGLARHLGIPTDIETALQALFTGKVVKIDTFYLNDRLSVNVSGLGFDGHVANLFGENKQRGFWGYARFVVFAYMRFAPFNAHLYQNSSQEYLEDNFIIAIANSAQYGNNAYIAPSSSVTDKQLHLVRIKKLTGCKGLWFGFRLFARSLHCNKTYYSMPVSDVQINTLHPVPYHIDGEPCGMHSRFDIRLSPASLPVIVPAANLTSI